MANLADFKKTGRLIGHMKIRKVNWMIYKMGIRIKTKEVRKKISFLGKHFLDF